MRFFCIVIAAFKVNFSNISYHNTLHCTHILLSLAFALGCSDVKIVYHGASSFRRGGLGGFAGGVVEIQAGPVSKSRCNTDPLNPPPGLRGLSTNQFAPELPNRESHDGVIPTAGSAPVSSQLSQEVMRGEHEKKFESGY